MDQTRPDWQMTRGRSRPARALLVGLLAWTVCVCAPALADEARPGSAASHGAIPDEFAPALGKPIWYAPHIGCLDRMWVAGGGDEGWSRRFPERSLRLNLLRAERDGGDWWYRFTWPDGSAGRVAATSVVDDLRFEALPTTFYQTCFFLQPPEDLAGFLRAQQPLAMQRYSPPSALERQREISRVEQEDARRATRRR